MDHSLSSFSGVCMDGLHFCNQVYCFFEEIRRSPGGVSRLRRRGRMEKKLLEALLPIAKYLQHSYRQGRYLSITWQDGNQTYDAEIVQSGVLIELGYYPKRYLVEVACVMHPNEHLLRECIDTVGSAFGLDGLARQKDRTIRSSPVLFIDRDYVAAFGQLLARELEKKAAKPYPTNTTLIVQCTLNRLYTQADWTELMQSIDTTTALKRFREIFIFDIAHHFSHSFSAVA